MLKNGERWTQVEMYFDEEKCLSVKIGIVSFGYKEYMPQFDLAPGLCLTFWIPSIVTSSGLHERSRVLRVD